MQTTHDFDYKTDRYYKRIQPEPVRDWSFGILTGHRLRVISYMVLGLIALYCFQWWLWPQRSWPQTPIEHVWAWGSLLWLGTAVTGGLSLVGMLLFRHPKHLDTVEPIDKLVSWRIVSRGTNVEVLTDTIRRCQVEMAKTPLFPYIIEVVTDTSRVNLPEPNDDLRYITVPKDYRTPNKALYKARALHYAAEHCPLPDDAWIVHLDEETQPTPSGIKGICAMIRAEEESVALRIGQGAVLYHRQWWKHPILTLADNVRTGDDFGRFYLGHRSGITFFGLHGSYIVVRNDVEKSVGFDFGPEGSITEDAFWALVAMEHGYRCRWVDGYLEEQSTQSVGDFVRQRRRWYQGLIKVARHAPVKLRWRLPLGFMTICWTVTPFATLYTLGHLFYGLWHPWWVIFVANFSFIAFVSLYVVGLTANLEEHGKQPRWFERVGWCTAQLILMPFFSLIEALGVAYAFLRPHPGFHVIKK